MSKLPQVARDTVFGSISLTTPSKMPGYSWSLPAGITCSAAKRTIRDFGKAAVCSGCYAKGGMYRTPNVKNAQARRLEWLRDSLQGDGGDTFVLTLVSMIQEAVERTGDPVFRVHDSGDLFSDAYINAWHDIAAALPEVSFWVPTREHYGATPKRLSALRALASLPNVAVRPSGAAIGDLAPQVEGLSAGTGVAFKDDMPTGFSCPSTTGPKGLGCEDHGCRACWDADLTVTYAAHGNVATSKATRAAVAGTKLPMVA